MAKNLINGIWNKLKEKESSVIRMHGNGMTLIETTKEYRYCCDKHGNEFIETIKKEAGY